MINFKKHPKGFYYKTKSNNQIEVGFQDVVFLLSYNEQGDILNIISYDINDTHNNEKNLVNALLGLLHYEVMLAPEKIVIHLNKNDKILEKVILSHHLTLGYSAIEGSENQFGKIIYLEYVK